MFYKIKKKILHLFYNTTIFLLEFKFFKKISTYFINAYFIDKGYCFDWEFLMSKSSNHLFQGENIFISKFNNLNIKSCLDIGANIGHYSKEILRTNTAANVIAFEPLPKCQDYLKKIRKKYINRFIYFNCALSNKAGFSHIYYDYQESPTASLETSVNTKDFIKNHNLSLKVELKKLDNFIDDNRFDNVDFIKIDIEGHEFKAIEGGMNFINKNNVKIIQIEFNWHHLFANNTIFQFSELLNNYKIFQLNLINGKLIEVDKNHYFSNIFHLSNFIFVEKNFFEKNKNILLNTD